MPVPRQSQSLCKVSKISTDLHIIGNVFTCLQGAMLAAKRSEGIAMGRSPAQYLAALIANFN